MSNEKRNIQSGLRIVTVVSYVNISFVFNQSRTENISQIPGSEMIKPQVEDPVYDRIVSDRKYYNVLYDWKNNGVSIPLLVPNINSSYDADYKEIDIPNSQTIINYSEYGVQTMSSLFILNSDCPLYFKGSTVENGITKDVYVNSVCSLNANERYSHNMGFVVSNADLEAGGQKTYSVDLNIYKDVIKSKYLGKINFSVKVVSTAGPGE